MRRLVNGRECEQCQIAQASTVREAETATGLIYYWRKTEIKCSATACETYGAHVVPTTFVLPFVFNGFPFLLSFFFFFFLFSDKTITLFCLLFPYLSALPSSFRLTFSHARHRLRNLPSESSQRRSCQEPSFARAFTNICAKAKCSSVNHSAENTICPRVQKHRARLINKRGSNAYPLHVRTGVKTGVHGVSRGCNKMDQMLGFTRSENISTTSIPGDRSLSESC